MSISAIAALHGQIMAEKKDVGLDGCLPENGQPALTRDSKIDFTNHLLILMRTNRAPQSFRPSAQQLRLWERAGLCRRIWVRPTRSFFPMIRRTGDLNTVGLLGGRANHALRKCPRSQTCGCLRSGPGRLSAHPPASFEPKQQANAERQSEP